ncbi:MAG TPA: exodeoxyribonuclease VII large subunit [Methylomirabilota bacterium]|nr:exodeoxyribonuclease VII large subunit [Methylomirabilota bacterium]
MARGKSQWDFGELFPPEATRRVFSVAELTGTIRRLLERDIGTVWVTGEVTNLRVQSSGHAYFTLKDAAAQLSCVLFRGEAVQHREALCDGQKLVLQGQVTVYEPRGQYQLRVTAIELQGVGALQQAFERLKARLQAEGLFAAERKRPIPSYPEAVGVVTSPTGAALRDVLHVVRRRFAGLRLVLAPCRVQGEGAAAEIAAAVGLLNEWSAAQPPGRGLDLILVTRGGGSLEDLWAFNEEEVARAIYRSALPVLSAVGHEIDFTISDFVADARAATPSAAAEIITDGPYRSREFVREARVDLCRLVRQAVERELARVDQLVRRLGRLHPRRWLQDRMQRIDDLQAGLARAARQGWRRHETAWQTLRQRLAAARPAAALVRRRERVQDLARRLREPLRHGIRSRATMVAALEARLRLLSPANVLARGYSITMDAATGRVIRDAAAVQRGQRLRTRLKSGEIHSRVEE